MKQRFSAGSRPAQPRPCLIRVNLWPNPMKLSQMIANDFDLARTLDSGQVFHWENLGGGFVGAIGDKAVYAEQRGNQLRFAGVTADVIMNYFSLDHPLAKICRSFPHDAAMTAARDFCQGLRILRQPPWECLATFICSSMKQVAQFARSRWHYGTFRHARALS